MRRLRRLPKRYAPFVYGMIQAAITSAVATAIATYPMARLNLQFTFYWLGCWALSLTTMLPVVILVSPLIQRAVAALTEEDVKGRRPPSTSID
jgi:high-affinity Fe2+/Pb2+ permease